jgi:glycosyltransferase involved in cell wall biosynthesis
MNILICSLHFYPETFRINDISKTLSNDKDLNIYVLTGLPNYPSGEIFKNYENLTKNWKNNSKIRLIQRTPIFLRGNGSTLSLILNYFSFIFFALIYGFLIFKNKKIDVIFTYGTSPIFQAVPGIILAKIFRCKSFLWVQDLWPDNLVYIKNIKNRYLLNLINFLVNKVYNFSDVIIAQSKSFEKIIKKRSKNKNIFYIPQPAPKIKKYKLKKKNKIFQILYFGNIGKAQSIETILGVSKILLHKKNIKIYCLGEGSEKKKIVSEKKKNKLNNLKILGFKSGKGFDRIIEKTDILLITMKKGFGFQTVIPGRLIHYFMINLPIVGAADGEIKRIINNSRSGLCTSAENISALSKTIIKYSKLDNEAIIKLRKNSYNFF